MSSSNVQDEVFLLWAQVDPSTPWSEWWLPLLKKFRWPSDLVIEKWNLQDLHWPRILDSVNSFTLFKQHKAILIFEADKAVKGVKDFSKLIERFQKGPHRVVLTSSESMPKSIGDVEFWKAPNAHIDEKPDDKASFRWIDSIHSENLTGAISALDSALSSQHHPFALLQLLTRDFRIGRLIHHAHQARLRENEMTASLKIPGFVVQKWIRRQALPNSQWSEIFNRLLNADLEMKSGAETVWVLRKLTFDLVQMTSNTQKLGSRRLRKPQPSTHAPQLWTILPSFA